MEALSPTRFFSRFHIFAQNQVNRSLITPPVFAEKRENIGIDAQGNLLLRPRPENCIREEIRPLLWNVGIVNVLIP